MIPKRKQFEKWTLPSKWSVVGGFITLFAAVFSVYAYFNPYVVPVLKNIIMPERIDNEAFNSLTQLEPKLIDDGKYNIKYSSGFDAPLSHGSFKIMTDSTKVRMFLTGKIMFKYYSFEFEGKENNGRFDGLLVNTNDHEVPIQPILVNFYRNQRKELVSIVELKQPVYREVKLILEATGF